MNLAYTSYKCPECQGSGKTPGSDEPNDFITCAACDGDRYIRQRRGTLKIMQLHLEAAESAFDASEAKDGNAFYRSLADKHWQLAGIYAAAAQAEALKALAGMEEARLKEILDIDMSEAPF